MHLAPIKQSKQTPPKPLPRRASASASPMPFLPRLGELLVAAGFMSGEAVESGLAGKQAHNRKVGKWKGKPCIVEDAD